MVIYRLQLAYTEKQASVYNDIDVLSWKFAGRNEKEREQVQERERKKIVLFYCDLSAFCVARRPVISQQQRFPYFHTKEITFSEEKVKVEKEHPVSWTKRSECGKKKRTKNFSFRISSRKRVNFRT